MVNKADVRNSCIGSVQFTGSDVEGGQVNVLFGQRANTDVRYSVSLCKLQL